MWMLALLLTAHAEDKPDGSLPTFADLQPQISCCVDREIIHTAIREKLDDIKACHTAAAGRGALRWTVQPDGTITDVSVATEDAGRDACLTAVIEQLSFPEIRCTLTVRYPVAFVGS